MFVRRLFREKEILNAKESHNVLNVEEKSLIISAFIIEGESIENLLKNILLVL